MLIVSTSYIKWTKLDVLLNIETNLDSLGSLYLGRDLLVVCKHFKLELNIRIILNIFNFSCEDLFEYKRDRKFVSVMKFKNENITKRYLFHVKNLQNSSSDNATM